MPSVDESEMWVMGMAGDGTGWAIPMRRREAVLAGLSSWIGLQVGPVKAPAEPAVRGFHAMFEQSRALGQVAAPGLVLPMVIAQTQAVRGMAAAATHDQGPLLKLAARYAEFTGWMAQEAGDDRVALGWTRTAVELAGAAGDRELGAHALVRQALIALYQEDPDQTVELARRARVAAAGSARIRGFAALREAQGHALLGDHDECRRALDDGQAALATAAVATTTGGTLALGPTSVPDMGAFVTGWCLHDLGRAEDAVEVLLPQLRTMPADARRPRARFGVRLVLAYLGAGAVDEACVLLDKLIDDVGMVDSATVRHDLRRVYRALPRWHAHPHAQDLHARLPGLLRVDTTRH